MTVNEGIMVHRGGPQDIPGLSRLVDEVMRPYAVPGQGMARRFPLLYQASNAHNFYFVEDPKTHRPISMAVVWRGTVVAEGIRIPMAAIGSVATAREHRSKTLASTILQRIWYDLQQDHVPITLISGQRNLYYRLGAIEAGSFIKVEVDACSSALQLWDGRLERISDQPEQFAEPLMQVYRTEPVRYNRTCNDMKHLLRGLAYPAQNMQHELFIAIRHKRIMAYAIIGTSDRWKGAHIMEWAGSREAIFSLAHYATIDLETPFTVFMVKNHDWSMRDLIERIGLPTVWSTNLGTMAIIDWKSFIDAIHPWLVESGAINKIKGINPDLICDGSDLRRLTQWVFSQTGLDFPWPYAGELNYV